MAAACSRGRGRDGPQVWSGEAERLPSYCILTVGMDQRTASMDNVFLCVCVCVCVLVMSRYCITMGARHMIADRPMSLLF
jgi:hypothetical protein